MSQECKQGNFYPHRCDAHNQDLITCPVGLQERIEKERKEVLDTIKVKAKEHYWDSFEDYKELLLVHLDFILSLIQERKAGLDESDQQEKV